MAASDNWRELARDFRSLAAERDHEHLSARWTSFDSGNTTWNLGGTESFQHRFKALAVRAARERNSSAVDLLETWLDTLRIKKPSVLLCHKHPMPLTWPEGEAKRISESYRHLCAASADLCSTFEADAIQTERAAEIEEQQLNDPRKWSPLRQRQEALKKIEELITGPHQEMPEELFRSVLAEQYGIKPEDVTWEQIRFEMGGLLSRESPPIALRSSRAISTNTPEKPPNPIVARRETFPKRAVWVADRLAERSWDQNTPDGFGGPDRKTVLRMLDGLPVKPESIQKLLVALNKVKPPDGKNEKLKLLDVPRD